MRLGYRKTIASCVKFLEFCRRLLVKALRNNRFANLVDYVRDFDTCSDRGCYFGIGKENIEATNAARPAEGTNTAQVAPNGRSGWCEVDRA
jgi:hypothetical protein